MHKNMYPAEEHKDIQMLLYKKGRRCRWKSQYQKCLKASNGILKNP